MSNLVENTNCWFSHARTNVQHNDVLQKHTCSPFEPKKSLAPVYYPLCILIYMHSIVRGAQWPNGSASDSEWRGPGPEVIKLFSSSAQLSMKFQLLINAKIVKISEKFRFKPQKLVIYPADKC